MNDPVYNKLRELSWRRKLTEAEELQLQAWLSAHPESREDWEAESGLNQLLEQLPEAPPVSSNFTALVLQAVERDAAAPARARQSGWRIGRLIHGWLPRVAIASLVVGFGLFSYHRHEVNDRNAMAQSVARLYPVVAASNLQTLEDLNTIRHLSDPRPAPDTKLLAMME
ncbi:MAG: hypothetical protein JWR19_2248 [Pedosphaera sp.]|nr:hypothetical protein [Pedosphaera sp.]